ncbi:GIY-YIG nuclease family protein [Streptomyces bauhiniae]|uniref:GIY-YIG nuclease family protein n=1 Tax=Streptomyces bauhiniae TaxID=2340725 RepID=A0A7K3QR90_9ACTN|nr:GIY-YIG nuclease family protein [Streptomyces bauhiniae]NEB92406.1 GIY-YIG nuclease family protein [Streptomyces bauhiniae]
MPTIETQPTAVYRLYGREGQLLYVGMTNNPDVRFDCHALTKRWWHLVVKRDVQWHPDRATARQCEADAIKAESPVHNAMHAAAGPHDTPLRGARQKLSTIVDEVRVAHEPRWLTYFGERFVALVEPAFHDEAVRNERIVNALREVDPELYERLAADD